jgi:hypothetical protein
MPVTSGVMFDAKIVVLLGGVAPERYFCTGRPALDGEFRLKQQAQYKDKARKDIRDKSH